MSTSTKTTKTEPAPVEADPRDVELAALRAELETVKAALGRLQELQAGTLRACPCGRQQGVRPGLFFMNGTAYCDNGHYNYFGIQE